MKKLGIYLFFLLPLMSCNDWLNVESEESVTYQTFFKSEQDIVAVVNGMFTYERAIMAHALNLVEVAGLYCDKLYDDGFKNLDRDRFFQTGASVSAGCSWGTYYSIIYFCNLLEENRYRFEGISDERADFWLAQANFMKALAFFRVAQLWGDAPIPENSSDLTPRGKSPLQEVLAEAVKAAEKALILPPREQLKDAYNKPITSKQYASRGSVYTLLSNIYAWQGGLFNREEDWKKAEEYATLVIGDGPERETAGHYQLEGNVKDMVTNVLGKARNSDEIIFSITYSSLDFDFVNSPIRYKFLYPGFLLLGYPYVTSDPWELENDGDFEARISVETVKDLFNDERDTRLQEYWYQLGEDKDGNPLKYAHINKWQDPIWNKQDIDDQFITAFDCNKVIWRLADLKLLRAECRARLGKAEAVNDLNDIRKRAGLDNYSGSLDFELLRREIFKERERELFGEGQHYYDAVRNGINPRNNFYLGRISPAYPLLSDADIQNGAIYLPVNENARKKNPYVKQNTYWLWRK